MELVGVVVVAVVAFVAILGVDFLFSLFSAFAPFLLAIFVGIGILAGGLQAVYSTIRAFFRVYLKRRA